MNQPGSGAQRAAPLEDPGDELTNPEHASSLEDDLSGMLQHAIDGDCLDLKQAVHSLVRRVSATEQRLGRLEPLAEEFSCKSAPESRLTELAGRVRELEEAIQMMCTLLKELDDPYGFGLSLDERLAGHGADPSPEPAG
jgi:hypothetical protein